MKPSFIPRFLSLVGLLLAFGLFLAPAPLPVQIPVTGNKDGGPAAPAARLPDLITFSDQVTNGALGQIAGLYVEEVYAFPVVQQPADQPAFVSTAADTLTQFRSAAAYGSLGFLAHDNLAGSYFSRLVYGDQIVVIFADDHYAVYRVIEIRRFQATQPTNPYSSFIDLATNQTLSAEQLFFQTYGVADHLVLQTCIAAQGNDSWGRLFIIAEPVPPEPPGKQSD